MRQKNQGPGATDGIVFSRLECDSANPQHSNSTRLRFPMEVRDYMPCGDCCGVEEPSQLLGHKRKLLPKQVYKYQNFLGFPLKWAPKVSKLLGRGNSYAWPWSGRVGSSSFEALTRVPRRPGWLIDPGFYASSLSDQYPFKTGWLIMLQNNSGCLSPKWGVNRPPVKSIQNTIMLTQD